VTLFSTDNRLGSAAGVLGRLAVRLSPALQVEGAVSYRRPSLIAAIASDVEGIPDVEAIERLTEVAFEAAVLVRMGRARSDARVAPFVVAGGGYLRQLHEQRTFVESGGRAYGGVGLIRMLNGPQTLGVRIEGRAVVQFGGAAVNGGAQAAPVAGASLFVRF
jgi:hypothetical protein